jgi:hypothetical protein
MGRIAGASRHGNARSASLPAGAATSPLKAEDNLLGAGGSPTGSRPAYTMRKSARVSDAWLSSTAN